MVNLERSFRQMLKKWGTDVTIITRTPKYSGGNIVKDNNGQTVYTERSVDTRCLLSWRHHQEDPKGEVVYSGKYVRTRFTFDDAENLRKKNSVIYDDEKTGNTYTFIINEVRAHKTHIECVLM